MTVDGEQFAIVGADDELRVERAEPNSNAVRVEGSVDVLRRLLSGDTNLLASIEADEIFIAGDPADLVRLDRMIWLTVAGAARAESAAPLHEELFHDIPEPKMGDRVMTNEKPKGTVEANGDAPSEAVVEPELIYSDVVIFGAGISGLTAAHELAERNFRVTVIDPEFTGLRGEGAENSNPGLGGMAKSQWCFFPVNAQGAPRGPTSAEEMRETLPRPTWSPIEVRYRIGDGGVASLGTHATEVSGEPRRTLEEELEDLARYVVDTKKTHGFDVSVVYSAADEHLDALGIALEAKLKAATRALSQEEAPSSLRLIRRRRPAPAVEPPFELDLVPFTTGAKPDTVIISINMFALPGEHGFRFFPSFYRHIFDTLKRIPLSRLVHGHESRDGTVFDNLIPTEEIGYVGRAKSRSVRVPRRPIRSMEEARRVIDGFLLEAGYTESDMVMLGRSFLKYLTSSRRRREKEYEHVSWYDFVEGDRFSPRARFLHETAPGTLVGLFGSHADARTQGTIALQLMKDSLGEENAAMTDMLLNGPTDVAWLAHWHRYLAAQAVSFRHGWLKEVRPDGEPVAIVVAEDGTEREVRFEPVNDVMREETRFIVALPLRQASEIAKTLVEQLGEDAARSSARDFAQLVKFANVDFEEDLKQAYPSGPLRHLSGIQYFFDQDIRVWKGHMQYLDADYGLSSVSQPQFWRLPQDARSGYRTVLSVDIGIWSTPSITDPCSPNVVYGWGNSRKFLATNVWEQLKVQHAGDFPESWPRLPTPYAYHVDDNLESDKDGNIIWNKSPYLVNQKGRYRKRPGWRIDEFDSDWRPVLAYDVAFRRWVMAGTHMQTATRITSMESACESGRRAVNALLSHLEIAGEGCAVWDPEDFELDALNAIKRIDDDLCQRGCPHPLDILRQ
ncbi:MAG: NAD(P)-binding protein [Labilithrix sp.]|nr:NAD(P)-binding protein [Labilithrix sp.]